MPLVAGRSRLADMTEASVLTPALAQNLVVSVVDTVVVDELDVMVEMLVVVGLVAGLMQRWLIVCITQITYDSCRISAPSTAPRRSLQISCGL